MLINWEPIPITEANGIIQFYRIILEVVVTSSSTSKRTRRETRTQTFEIPANQSSVVIGGLDPGLTYRIIVDATNNARTSDPQILPPPPGMYDNM